MGLRDSGAVVAARRVAQFAMILDAHHSRMIYDEAYVLANTSQGSGLAMGIFVWHLESASC
jgi:hypothetical protein